MRFAALLLLTVPAFAQLANRTSPAAAAMPANPAPILTQTKAVRIPLSSFVTQERAFDVKLSAMADAAGPVDLLGATRGIYLDGYGVVFTTELGLVATATINPFNKTITDAQKTRVHAAKVARLPALQKAMAEMVRDVAANLAQVPENQQVVVAVRLDYLNWENTAGLPGLIVARADRRSAMAGSIQIEEQ